MPIDEVEVAGASFSCTCYNFKVESINPLFKRLTVEEEVFDLGAEKAGFHDLDSDGKLIRGWYSQVVPFEVEHLSDGMVTKTLLKRVESCEFFAMNGVLFATGKQAPQKAMAQTMTALSGFGVTPFEFEFTQMSQFQERLSMLKAIVLTNPKDREVRRARLAGRIENYSTYNVIDPRNHGIDSVSGLIDGPLGPMTLTVSSKGKIRLNVRKGFLLTIDCLKWVLAMVRDEKPPAMPQLPASAFKTKNTEKIDDLNDDE